MKRTMRVRYLYWHHFIWTLVWLLAACTGDLEISGDNGESGQVSITPVDIMAKLAVGDKAQVSKVRVIIFSTRTSRPYDPKVLIANEVIDINDDYVVKTYVGYNDIYVIGNEPANLASIQTSEELKAIRVDTQAGGTVSDPVLFKQLLNVRIKSKDEIYLDGESSPVSKLEIKLQYVMAKLSVDFDLSTEVIEGGNTPTGVYLDFKSMEIVRIPKHCGLIPQKYSSDEGYLDNSSFSLLDNASTEKNHFKWSSGEIYLPEHLIENNEYRTVLRIKGFENNTTHTYTLPIGDAMNSVDSRSTDWNVTRNRHYKLTVKAITGYGEESLETSARVAGWSEINVPVEIPGASFLSVNSSEIEVKSLRFYTYTSFASSGSVSVNIPGLSSNYISYVVEYDDETKRSGRVGFRQGNWPNDGKSYTATLTSGTATVKLNLHFRVLVMKYGGRGNWAYAMGYPSSANSQIAGGNGYYNPAFYSKVVTPTGCNAYHSGDPDDIIEGKGCWRLATIYENQKEATLIGWCIEEYDADRATKAYQARKGYFGDTSKSQSQDFYCVLDIRPPELSDFIVSEVDVENISQNQAEQVCTSLGSGWRLPTEKETNYVFAYAGTNGLPNNFFSDSYWGKVGSTFIVATISDPDGSETTDALRSEPHSVRCVKSRY